MREGRHIGRPRVLAVCDTRSVERTLQVYESFEEADQADRRYYASLTPQQRLDLVLDLVQRHNQGHGETSDRLERVYRVDELSRR